MAEIDRNKNPNENPDLISGRKMMGMIGLLAFLLPIILFFVSILNDDCKEIQTTISAYYHTGANDIFVGMICALAFAFFAYQGYDKKNVINDSLLGTLASVFALGVAFFPTTIDPFELSCCIENVFDNGIKGTVHYVSAILLFITLAYFSIFQFTKNNDDYFYESGVWSKLTSRKKSVNRFYIICGLFIIVCLILAGIYFSLNKNGDLFNKLSPLKPIFFIETAMLWAFSFAWLRKSKMFGIYENETLE